jgi:hypothetical protein
VRDPLLTYDFTYAQALQTSRVSARASRRDGGGGTAMMALLARLIRGEGSGDSPGASGSPVPEDVVASALRHGVLPLAYEGLGVPRHPDDGLNALRRALAGLARTEAAVDAIRGAACRDLLHALHHAGLSVLVFKGGALAFSHYPRPDLRPRDDTDLLVEESQLTVLDATMRNMGHSTSPASGGRLISHQCLYTRVDGRGIRHNFDVHWRISNRHRYARLFTLTELLERSRPIPAHAALARCPCPVDALLIAALHRASHRGTDRLVWLYDIHRLLAAMNDRELGELEERAAIKGLTDECRVATAGARHYFGGGTASPPTLSWGVRTIDIWLADLKALPSWRARLALLKEHAFPPADYMRRNGGADNRLVLPIAYLTRGLRGSLKLFRRI